MPERMVERPDPAMTRMMEAVLAGLRPAVAAAGGALDDAAARAAVLNALGGGRLGNDPLEKLLDMALDPTSGVKSGLVWLGNQVVDVVTVSGRVVLTHCVTPVEQASDRLDCSVDLGVFGQAGDLYGGLHLPDGTRLRPRERRERNVGRAGIRVGTLLEGPPGWLAEFRPGQLVAVRAANGMLGVEPIDDVDLAADPPDLRALFDELYTRLDPGGRDDLPEAADSLQLLVAVTHADWFSTPRRPFGDLARAAGLEVEGHMIGAAGCWERYVELSNALGLALRYSLEDASHETLTNAVDAFESWSDGAGTEEVAVDATLVGRLHRHWSAVFALDDELRRRQVPPVQLGDFAAALTAAARGPSAVVGVWLDARAAARGGRPTDGERLAQQALALDGDFVPAIEQAAWYAEDRGRAREAVNHLQRISEPDSGKLATLQQRARLQAPDTGRNEPCPCGSGRKFKQCHLGRPEVPEHDRVCWLLDKARAYVEQMASPELLDEVLHRYCDEFETAHQVAFDLLLFDEGWLARFLDGRRALLDPWEVATVERWLTDATATVFHIEEIDDAVWRLREPTTGQLHEVDHAPDLDEARPHQLVWARLLPVSDDRYACEVARTVFLAERSRFLTLAQDDLEPSERLALLLDAEDPDAVAGLGAEPRVYCIARLRPPVDLDMEDVIEGLDGVLRRGDFDDDPPYEEGGMIWWPDRDPDEPAADPTSSVVIDDEGRVVVTASTVAAFESLLEVLGDAVPLADVVTDVRTPRARQLARAQEVDAAQSLRVALGVEETDDGEGDEDEDFGLDYMVDDYLDDVYDDEDEDEDDGAPQQHEPSPESYADLAAEPLFAEARNRWLDRPHRLLDGYTPRDAAGDEKLRLDLLTLLAEMPYQLAADGYRADLGLG